MQTRPAEAVLVEVVGHHASDDRPDRVPADPQLPAEQHVRLRHRGLDSLLLGGERSLSRKPDGPDTLGAVRVLRRASPRPTVGRTWSQFSLGRPVSSA